MTIQKEDFMDWVKQPVTKVIMKVLSERIRDREFELGMRAGSDPLSDRYTVGGIAALRELIQINWEDLEGEDE